jgi:hypothetical protein
MSRVKGSPKLGGRVAGTPNKVTADARAAIAAFVDNNAHRLAGWLDAVAKDNPEKAFQLFQSVVEYHVPKLARSEQTVNAEVKITQYRWLDADE